MGFQIAITVPGGEVPILAPAGVSSPQAACLGCTVQEWDISHFLRTGRRDAGPALNPKGGLHELKLLVEPMVMRAGQPARFATKRIRRLLP